MEAKQLKSNICIVGIATNFIKKISKHLADELDMFYADIMDLLQYDLLDIDLATKQTSPEYVSKLLTNKVKNVATYENTVFTINYAALTENNNYNLIKGKSLIIYLKLDPELLQKALQQNKTTKSMQTISSALYNDRDSFCSKFAELVINLETLNDKQILNTIFAKVNTYYN